MTYAENNKWSAPAPETMSQAVVYTLDISPAADYKTVGSAITTWHKIMTDITVNGTEPICTYQLFAEISRTGRIHFHGMVLIRNIVDFYLITLRELQTKATYKVDTIECQSFREAYMTKSTPLLKAHNIKKTSFDNTVRAPAGKYFTLVEPIAQYKEYLAYKESPCKSCGKQH